MLLRTTRLKIECHYAKCCYVECRSTLESLSIDLGTAIDKKDLRLWDTEQARALTASQH
jgi:hypothetical protein